MAASQAGGAQNHVRLDPSPSIEIVSDATSSTITLTGNITVYTVTPMEGDFTGIADDRAVRVDLSGVSRLDTAGAWMLIALRRRIEAAGQSFEIMGASPEAESLLRSVSDAAPQIQEEETHSRTVADILERVGLRVMTGVAFLLELIGYFGIFLARMARALRHPREFRFTALVHHCDDVGVKAVPIVALMAFLIGVVLAFQGATQLRQFGAEVFVVDLIAISILRELGILLTSIIVAGRTASAFTAAIGSMKMREEIDAMRTLGLDPAMVLFVPRILALLLMLPILGLIANVSGLLGGALMAWANLGISPEMFRTRLVEGTDVSNVFVGLIKAPFFALIIGVIGCHAGMKVQSNAESLGQMTSNAVVASIFAVIMADAVFSIFFAQVGW